MTTPNGTTEAARRSADGGASQPLLEVADLNVTFQIKTGMFGRRPLRAVRDVSFRVGAGESLGIIGESGSGKSSTGRAVLRLIEPSSGSIKLDGQEIVGLPQRELRGLRSKMQMVFQDPSSSLNPSMTVGESIAEPLSVHTDKSKRERREEAARLLELVRLSKRQLDRYPYEFSGGQRQRISIARAIALQPKLIILDEAVSALDVSTQNEIVNLLNEFQAELGLSYLFIAHDLAVVEHIAPRVGVMYLGELVETGPTENVFAEPRHPYTRSLLSSVPSPTVADRATKKRIPLLGETPDPINAPSGCSFHTRCSYAMDVCRTEHPPRVTYGADSAVQCHLHTTGPKLAGRPLAGADVAPTSRRCDTRSPHTK